MQKITNLQSIIINYYYYQSAITKVLQSLKKEIKMYLLIEIWVSDIIWPGLMSAVKNKKRSRHRSAISPMRFISGEFNSGISKCLQNLLRPNKHTNPKLLTLMVYT